MLRDVPHRVVEAGNIYWALMPTSSDRPVAESADEIGSRIVALTSELAVAREAATAAEAEQGRLQGELTKVTDYWVASHRAQEQWDVLFSQNIEDLRLANERADNAEGRYQSMRSSSSWQVIQAVLAPYRWARGIR